MKKIQLIPVILIICSTTLFSQYVEVIKDNANIRSGPSTNNEKICAAVKGDIFAVKESSGEWYYIKIGYGKEKRYIHKSLCKETEKTPSLPSESTCKNMFVDFRRAEHNASNSADREVPATSSNYADKFVEAEGKYFSKYTLDVFHKYGVAPVLYNKIIDMGFEKKWTNIPLYP